MSDPDSLSVDSEGQIINIPEYGGLCIADMCVFAALKAGHNLAASKDIARKYMTSRQEFLKSIDS